MIHMDLLHSSSYDPLPPSYPRTLYVASCPFTVFLLYFVFANYLIFWMFQGLQKIF